jgi:putative transposase
MFRSFTRDYLYQAGLESVEAVARQLLAWIEHYSRQAPHSALGMRSPAECYADWLVKNKQPPVQI